MSSRPTTVAIERPPGELHPRELHPHEVRARELVAPQELVAQELVAQELVPQQRLPHEIPPREPTATGWLAEPPRTAPDVDATSLGADTWGKTALGVASVEETSLGATSSATPGVPSDPEPSGNLLPGSVAGEYRILEVIGKGAFGTVYRAVHPVIDKEVAIKVLDHSWSADPTQEQRFVAEAKAVNRIKHPNIVDIFGFGQLETGQKFYVMELLHGETLSEYLSRSITVPLPEAVHILSALASALDAAHSSGILHRDLKPANVFLQRDNSDNVLIKLLDFGVAKVMDETATTKAGMMMGTPAYMAPEQCVGDAVSAATDVYALGIIAYEILTGARPFSSTSLRGLIALHLFEAPPPASRMNPALPAEIDPVLMRMLAKTPADRPASASAAIDELKPWLVYVDSSAFSLPPASAHAAQVEGGRSQPSRWLLFAGAVALVAALFGMFLFGASSESETQLAASNTGAEPSVAVARGSVVPTPAAAQIARPVTAASQQLEGARATLPAVQATEAGRAVAEQPAASLTASLPQVIELRIEGTPKGAVVQRGSKLLGRADEVLRLPGGKEPVELRITAPGYYGRKLSVTPNQHQKHTLKLVPIAASAAGGPAAGGPAAAPLATTRNQPKKPALNPELEY